MTMARCGRRSCANPAVLGRCEYLIQCVKRVQNKNFPPSPPLHFPLRPTLPLPPSPHRSLHLGTPILRAVRPPTATLLTPLGGEKIRRTGFRSHFGFSHSNSIVLAIAHRRKTASIEPWRRIATSLCTPLRANLRSCLRLPRLSSASTSRTGATMTVQCTRRKGKVCPLVLPGFLLSWSPIKSPGLRPMQ